MSNFVKPQYSSQYLKDQKVIAERDATIRQQAEQIERLADYVRDDAGEPCAYGDNCPPFVKLNHYQCRSCKARAALTTAAPEMPTT